KYTETGNQLIKLSRQAEDYFFSGISSQCLNLNNTAVAYMTGVQAESLNIVYINKFPNSLEDVLIKSNEFYEKSNISFVVIIPQEFCTNETQDVFNMMKYR